MEETDSRTFAEWKVLELVDPEGSDRNDWHVARLLAMISNVFGDGSSARAPKDFWIDLWEAAVQQDVSPKDKLEALLSIPGVKIKRKGRLFDERS